MFIIELLCILL